jgi:hypothetical protein
VSDLSRGINDKKDLVDTVDVVDIVDTVDTVTSGKPFQRWWTKAGTALAKDEAAGTPLLR